MISLTATPPYEGEPALWERYISMCGEIDEEITVPELVKEGTLCPHQTMSTSPFQQRKNVHNWTGLISRNLTF